MNEHRTRSNSDTRLAQAGSRPVRYELIDKDGKIWSTFGSAKLAGDIAKLMWPDQEQDPDRTGKGWDVQVVGAK